MNNVDKLKVDKPKSMILDEIKALEVKKKETKSIALKLKYYAEIQKLSFQLKDQ